MKKYTSVAAIILLALAGFFVLQSFGPGKSEAIEYKNRAYGFSLPLPDTWKGYSVVTGTWVGESPNGGSSTQGTMISIRHPLWEEEAPRQDIPIMIFTIDEWNSMERGDFHIGAAPINPRELGRNTRYVFALPARYNFSFPTGFEEVEAIIANTPLQTFEP